MLRGLRNRKARIVDLNGTRAYFVCLYGFGVAASLHIVKTRFCKTRDILSSQYPERCNNESHTAIIAAVVKIGEVLGAAEKGGRGKLSRACEDFKEDAWHRYRKLAATKQKKRSGFYGYSLVRGRSRDWIHLCSRKP